MRLRAAAAAPYFASLLLAMPVHAVEGITAAVDRSARLYLGLDYFASLSDDEAVGLLLHEVRHVVHGHSERADRRGVTPGERSVWNIAADLTINDDLLAGGFELPEGGVSCAGFDVPEGLGVEAYFDRLRTRDFEDTPACGSGAGAEPGDYEFGDADDSALRGGDEDRLGCGLSDLDIELQRRHVAGEVAEHVANHGIGSVPAELRRWAEEQLRPPSVPWREQLRSAVRRPLQIAAGVDDYTWRRPNRRRRSGGVILPATNSNVPRVTVAVDTSGSIGRPLLRSFVAEITAMSVQFRVQPRDVSVIPCDAMAHDALTADAVQRGVELPGGGGTDMRCGIDAAVQASPRPDLVVVFTDGHTPWPDLSPEVPVVIAVAGVVKSESLPTWASIVRVGSLAPS